MIPATTSMREFAIAKTATLLEEAVAAIQVAAGTPDEAAVHKMRVAIRRLQQALRIFRQYFKASGVKYVKDQLRAIMQIAGELRNQDIGIELVQRKRADAAVGHFKRKRGEYKQDLESLLQQYGVRDFAVDWRQKLGLDLV
jgi:hypothetical protein